MVLFLTVLYFLLFSGFFMRSWVLCSISILCLLWLLVIFKAFCGFLVAFLWFLVVFRVAFCGSSCFCGFLCSTRKLKAER